MAYEIVLCDDDSAAAAIFLPKIRAVFKNYVGNLSITSFQSSQRLLTYILSGNACDILFMDIDMPEMNGITLCRHLQEHGCMIPVVFLSNMEHRVYETFEFPTVYFLRKRFFDEEIEKVAKRVLQEAPHKPKTVVFSNGTQSYRLVVNSIKYLEIIDQTLHIYTKNDQISLRYKMDHAEELLLPHGFLRVHKGYLVNNSYIDCIQREELRLTDGTRIPVSRRRYKRIKEEFLRLTTDEIRNGDSI